MTYGEVSSQLRETMIWLLERRRIQQRIGGAGAGQAAVVNTDDDRRRLGAEIQRYRAAILTYCLVTMRAATPGMGPSTKERFRDPVAMLRHRLERAHAELPHAPALSDLLERSPEFELVLKPGSTDELVDQCRSRLSRVLASVSMAEHPALPPGCST